MSANNKKTSLYPTLKQAAAAAKQLGIKSMKEYRDLYHSDPKLPAAPQTAYSDFPGWKDFLQLGKNIATQLMGRGNRPVSPYATIKQATAAVQRLGITSMAEYRNLRKEDPKLPGRPEAIYSPFPGWKKFLGQ